MYFWYLEKTETGGEHRFAAKGDEENFLFSDSEQLSLFTTSMPSSMPWVPKNIKEKRKINELNKGSDLQILNHQTNYFPALDSNMVP